MEDLLRSYRNSILVRACPLPRDLKRFWMQWASKIHHNNGVAFANQKISDIEVGVKTWLASGRDVYPHSGVRKSGWYKWLLRVSTEQPSAVLNFLRLLRTRREGKPGPIWPSVYTLMRTLDENRTSPPVPLHLSEWLDLVLSRSNSKVHEVYRRLHPEMRNIPDLLLDQLQPDSWRRLRGYRDKWRSILLNRNISEDDAQWHLEPLSWPSDEALERDTSRFFAVMASQESPLQDSALRRWIWEQVPEDLEYMFLTQPPRFDPLAPVGVVELRYKDNSKYRPIANPNKWLQLLTLPIHRRIRRMVVRNSSDAQLDQSRFDTSIEARVGSESKFVTSVDLSQATEHMPLEWALDILLRLPMKEEEQFSLLVATYMSRAAWDISPDLPGKSLIERPRAKDSLEQYYLWCAMNRRGVRWHVGQPLGVLPSFGLLSITHSALLESCSFWCGHYGSPYRILGDDVVIFSRHVRNLYLRILRDSHIPVASHKSFSQRLTEFAGRVFVRNRSPFKTPNDSEITTASLFDWQVGTGLRIPWVLLPKSCKRMCDSIAKRELNWTGRRLYEFTQRLLPSERPVHGRMLAYKTGFEILSQVPREKVLPEKVSTTAFRWRRGVGLYRAGHRKMLGKDGRFYAYVGRLLETRKAHSWWFRKHRALSARDTLSLACRTYREVETYARFGSRYGVGPSIEALGVAVRRP